MPNNRPPSRIAPGLLLMAAAAIAGASEARAQGVSGSAPASPAPATLPNQGGVPIPGLTPPAAAPGKDEPPSPAEASLDEAIAKVKALGSVSADVVQTVDMLGQKFEIKGNYLKGKGHRVYLKLAVTGLGDTAATTLQVCDGATLWDSRQVLDTQTYQKTNLVEILKKIADPILEGPIRDQIDSRLGFAGPDALLVGLRKAVRFDQRSEETFEGKPVLLLRGQWKDRAGLVGPGQQPIPPTQPLPSYIPSNVAVWIGVADGWPAKVEMVGNPPSMLLMGAQRFGPDGRPLGNKAGAPKAKVAPSKVTLLYSNVKLNPELNPESFAFPTPADAKNVQDVTDTILAELDTLIQYETSRKKAEAGKLESTLPGAIDVPSPTATPAPR